MKALPSWETFVTHLCAGDCDPTRPDPTRPAVIMCNVRLLQVAVKALPYCETFVTHLCAGDCDPT